jgi:hypothetical protein
LKDAPSVDVSHSGKHLPHLGLQPANTGRQRYHFDMSLASGSAIAGRIVVRLLGCIPMDEVHFAHHLRLPGGKAFAVLSTGVFANDASYRCLLRETNPARVNDATRGRSRLRPR